MKILMSKARRHEALCRLRLKHAQNAHTNTLGLEGFSRQVNAGYFL